MTDPNLHAHDASFRDPSGYVFVEEGIVKRRILPIYFPQYKALKEQRIYDTLIRKELLIPHQETEVSEAEILLTPEQIPYITYPYEWGFEQYKQAALLTLKLQKYLLSKGFILKDASAYNITFHKGRAVFIDTLSFDFYEENTPWRAYKQFITHFLGPLILTKYHGPEMLKMMQTHIDGIPVSLIASLLPGKTKLNPTLYTNIHLLAKMESKHQEDYEAKTSIAKLSKKAQDNMLKGLFQFIQKLALKKDTEWGNYYEKTNYDAKAFEAKKKLVQQWVTQLKPDRLIDMGGNDGTFARTVRAKVAHVMVTDIDTNAVDQNMRQMQKNNETNMLPWVCDVLQPAPGIGFHNTERSSMIARLQAYQPDVVMALALIHHITLSGNVPFEKSAAFFASFSNTLLIEFPKRTDSWVTSLLVRKREFKGHFDHYNQSQFEAAYERFFECVEKQPIAGTERVLYHFKRKDSVKPKA
ncbi:class I SAM-dependent methyltransferase [Altibacter sp. HG106]|uniref:class I SAM-dependent methyltransferase n=1 Tax=Altibacter sp. HG106 TaxID=3023937 RepID=UPI00234FDD47|nr:class I SAM-dependent methyltransferase [Altibacter sp. HG106]MDC7996138.1 class I SAM-dependent methyltransferase [Altibacter sp. HG106]